MARKTGFSVLMASIAVLLTTIANPAAEPSPLAANSWAGRADPDAANWDIGRLDAARDADYLTGVEKDVILETNKMRSDPKKYAALYISPMLQHFNGNRYSKPGRITLVTQEGASAVNECIGVLNRAPSAGLLAPDRGLSLAVRDLAADQGRTGQTGHTGSDGSTLSSRCAKYGKSRSLAENLGYGASTGQEIVISLLIDDGVPSRGHRINMMNGDYTQTGAAFGPHPQYRSMCAIVYARDYVSAVTPPAASAAVAKDVPRDNVVALRAAPAHSDTQQPVPDTPTAGLTLLPNPAVRSSTSTVTLFWQGKRLEEAALPVFDASGKLISGIEIKGGIASGGGAAKRRVGFWNLKGLDGRPVPAGTYFVRGVLTASDGEKMRVELPVVVR